MQKKGNVNEESVWGYTFSSHSDEDGSYGLATVSIACYLINA